MAIECFPMLALYAQQCNTSKATRGQLGSSHGSARGVTQQYCAPGCAQGVVMSPFLHIKLFEALCWIVLALPFFRVPDAKVCFKWATRVFAGHSEYLAVSLLSSFHFDGRECCSMEERVRTRAYYLSLDGCKDEKKNYFQVRHHIHHILYGAC